jgi:hypothetical protein
MRGLRDISKLAAAAALMFGIAGWGALGCSAQDSGVDAAPPVEGELVEIDEIDETDEMQEEAEQY